MTDGKNGAVEWLRGIIEEYEASGSMRCSAMAKMFGVYCEHEKTCRDCMSDMMTAVAVLIDREMVEKERLKKENAELREVLACGQNYHLNMMARAKKLVGIEEEARNEHENGREN